jgi:hypothetical protein
LIDKPQREMKNKNLERLDGKLFEKLNAYETTSINQINGGGGIRDALVGWLVGKVLDTVVNDPKIIAKGGDPLNGHYIDPIKRPLNPEPATETVGIVLQSGI